MDGILPFSLKGETIHSPITCKNSDVFSKLEEKLYLEYPKLKNKNIFFITNGNIINRSANIEQNRIKNGDTILIKDVK